MELQNKILAVIWDFDGTIADSRQKNFNVTKKIMENILGTDSKIFPVLNSLEDYHSAHTQVANWREFYRDSFSLTENQVDKAGRLWTEYQLKDQTPIPLIRGVGDAISALSKFPQGIVSQNSRSNIIRYLKEKNMFRYFQAVIGYEEVHIARQKPVPDGLLICMNKLIDSESGYVLYIGDHETDVQCALNANNVLKDKKMNLKIISIGAFYGFEVDTSGWSVLPDYQIQNASDIKSIIDNF